MIVNNLKQEVGQEMNLVGILVIVLLGAMTMAIVIGLEIALLLAVGFTYESWQALAMFIVVFGVIEFIGVGIIKGWIKAKVEQHMLFHQFWLHLLFAFVCIMGLTQLLGNVSISLIGGIIYALISAGLYTVFDRVDRKREDTLEK